MRTDTLLTKWISRVNQVKKSSSHLPKGKGLDRCVYIFKQISEHNRYFITMPLERNQPLRRTLYCGACGMHTSVTEQMQHRAIHHSSSTVCSSLQGMSYVRPVPESTVKLVSNQGTNITKRFGTFPKCHFWPSWINSEQLTHSRESQTVSMDLVGGSGLAHANRDGLHNVSSQWSNSSSSLRAIKNRWGLWISPFCLQLAASCFSRSHGRRERECCKKTGGHWHFVVGELAFCRTLIFKR